MSTRNETAPVAAADVTEELIKLTESIVDGWYPTGPVEWDAVWDRLDGSELIDGTKLDLGSDLNSPALRKLKRSIRARRTT